MESSIVASIILCSLILWRNHEKVIFTAPQFIVKLYRKFTFMAEKLYPSNKSSMQSAVGVC